MLKKFLVVFFISQDKMRIAHVLNRLRACTLCTIPSMLIAVRVINKMQIRTHFKTPCRLEKHILWAANIESGVTVTSVTIPSDAIFSIQNLHVSSHKQVLK